MNCRDFEEHVTAFVEGCLKETICRDMENHLACCPKCARLTELQHFITASLNDTAPVRAPEGLAERIIAATESEVSGKFIEFTPAETHYADADRQGISSIDCKGFEDHAAAYVDGELKGNLLSAMEAHRTSCLTCERLVSVHKIVLASLDHAETVRAPKGMANRIFATVEAESAEAEEVFGAANKFRKYGLVAAAMAAVSTLSAIFIILSGIFAESFSIVAGWSDIVHTAVSEIAILPLIFKAWIAGNLSAEHWILINRFIELLHFPLISLSLPPYYFVVIIFCAASLLIISLYHCISFQKPVY